MSDAPPGYVGQLWSFNANVPGCTQLAFSPDGKYVVSAGHTSCRVLAVEDGRPISCFAGTGEAGWHSRFLGRPLYLLFGVCPWAFLPAMLFEDEAKQPVCAAGFTPDGGDVVTVGYDGAVRRWNARNGRQRKLLAQVGFVPDPSAVAFSPHGTYVATAARRQTRLWDLATGTMRWEASGDGAIGLTPDGRLVAVTDRLGVTVRDARTGTLVAEQSFENLTHRAIPSIDGQRILVALGNAIVVRDLQTTREWTRWMPAEGYFISPSPLAWLPGEESVLLRVVPVRADAGPGVLLVVNLSTAEVSCQLECPGHVTSVAISADGTLAATLDSDNTIRLWRLPSVLSRPGPDA